MPKGLNDQVLHYENRINTLTTDIHTLEGQKIAPMGVITGNGTKDEKNMAKTTINTLDGQIQAKNKEIETSKNNIQAAQTKKDQIEQEKKDLETFWTTYRNIIGTSNATGTRKRLSDLIRI